MPSSQTKYLVLFFVFFLLIPLAFASPLSDALFNINLFFENQEYIFYSALISFAAFFIFFTAVIFLGLKNYFHAENTQVKAVSMVLALAFSIALVNQGYSIIVFFEYIKIILFILLVALMYYFFSKKIQNKFLAFFASVAFVLALFVFFSFLINKGERTISESIIDSLNRIEI